MRLIDADALKEKTIGHGEKIAYVVSFIWDVDESPTIKAIPVEWLREWQDEVGTLNEWWPIIERIITVWQKEQEAR